MKSWKHLLSVVLAIVLVFTGLTGCGSNNDDKKDSVKDNAKTESEKTDSEKTDSDKTEVVIWTFSFWDKDVRQELKEEFAKEGKDIELVFKDLPQGTASEISEKLVTNLIGGEKIDIYDANVAEYYNFATKGLYEPLNKYYEADGFDVNALNESTVEMSKIDGNLYALPYIRSKFILYYNKNIFDEAGVAYPTDDWTWDDFREASKKLTKGEGADKVWGCTIQDWPVTWTGYATQSGATFMKDKNTPNLDDPLFKEGLQFKYDITMVDKSAPSLAENKMTKTHYSKQFAAGNVGMIFSGDWVIGSLAKDLNEEYPFEYNVAKLPHPKGVAEGTTYGASRYLGINSRSDEKTKQAAWEVLKFFASPTVARIMAENRIALPSVTDEAVTKAYLENVPDFVTNAGIILEDAPYVEEKAMHPASNIINQITKEESELVLTDAKPIDAAMEDMQKRITDEIKNMN